MYGGVGGELDEKVIFNDFWFFDFVIHRWIPVKPVTNLHQANQVYGHSIEVYCSQNFRQNLTSKENVYDLYINKKKAKQANPKSKQLQLPKQTVNDQQTMDELVSNNNNTNINTNNNEILLTNGSRKLKQTGFDLES